MFRQKTIALAVGGISALAGCAMWRGPDQSFNIEPVMSIRNGGMDSEAFYRAGKTFQAQRRYDRAAAAYRNALAENPDHAEAHNALGIVYSMQGRIEQAELEFKSALALAPLQSHLHNNLGYFYLQQGRVLDATMEFENARRLDPANAYAANNLTLATQSAGLPDASGTGPATADAAIKESEPKSAAVPAPAATESVNAAATAPTMRMLTLAPNVWELLPRQVIKPTRRETPASASAPAQPDDRVHSIGGRIPIEISNGNGVTGLAARVGGVLQEQGYPRPRLTNQIPYDQAKTEIQYVAGAESAARSLGATFPIPIRIVAVPKIERQMQLRVVLGKDFGVFEVATKARGPALKYVVF
jgi:tetratricopeptide (TPR) repeat protein